MAVEVALFVTCLVDQLAPEAGVAAVRLLEAAGCRVAFPEAQSCCGQPALNTGEPEAAAVLARHFVEVFEPYEAVVTPSGSCAAMVHHWYPRILDGAWAERAEAVAARTYELTSFLVDRLGATDGGRQGGAARRGRDGDGPRRLSRPAGAGPEDVGPPAAGGRRGDGGGDGRTRAVLRVRRHLRRQARRDLRPHGRRQAGPGRGHRRRLPGGLRLRLPPPPGRPPAADGRGPRARPRRRAPRAGRSSA